MSLYNDDHDYAGPAQLNRPCSPDSALLCDASRDEIEWDIDGKVNYVVLGYLAAVAAN